MLNSEFYLASSIKLAPIFLGKLLCRKLNDDIVKFKITETECYFGENDTACHASKGRTHRTNVMYKKGGITYVYICYGIHNLLNIVTGPENHPQAVLIRGIENYNGPAKLTKALNIDRNLNGKLLNKETGLWIEDNDYIAEYITSTRIGINYASLEDRNKLWRFIIKK